MLRRKFLQQGSRLMGAIPLINSRPFNVLNPLSLAGTETVTIKTGAINCTVFRDLLFKYTAEDFFMNADAIELKQALEKYQLQPGNIASPFIAVLLQSGNKKILIDTGAGFLDEPFMTRAGAVVWKGRLQQLLREAGIKNEDITDVVVTHCHPDHVGGIYASGSTLNFPNAVFHLHEDEWNFWHTAASASQPPLFKTFIEKNITPLKNEKLQLCRGEAAELMPGITAIRVAGHTPGQIALDIHSGSEHLLYIADAFLHPLHIERTDWQTIYDLDHAKAKQSRIRYCWNWHIKIICWSTHFILIFPALVASANTIPTGFGIILTNT